MSMTNALPLAEEVHDETPSGSLRLVLFGMPDAGKSSLLGALAQSAETQERELQGRFPELDPELQELKARVYGGKSKETLEEIVPYPVVFEPFIRFPQASAKLPVTLYDCDGRTANELLTQRKTLQRDATKGSLAEAILRADALLLLIDASGKIDQIEADFREFRRFLRHLTQYRAERSSAGGLPVFLVLSKCDKLAQPGDSTEQWKARIAQREQQVRERFEEFLTKKDDSVQVEWLAFGSLYLRPAHTAVNRPDLSDWPASPNPAPWGVGDLFHDAIESAHAYRQRLTKSQRRLFWTLIAASSLIGIMLLVAAWQVLVSGPEVRNELISKIQNYQSREGQTPSQRLASGTLYRRLNELTELRADPDFEKLDKETRQYVEERLAEMQAYRDFRDRLEELRSPAEVRNEREAEHLKELLDNLKVPEKYRSEWEQTEAVQLRNKWLNDLRLLTRAVNEVYQWYQGLRSEASQLLVDPRTLDNQWNQQVRELFRKADSPPFRENDRLPDSTSLPHPRGGVLTYKPAFNFEQVRAAIRQWEDARDQLERLQAMASTLGLIEDADSILVMPQLDPTTNVLTLSRDRLARMEQKHPRFREWSFSQVPDAAQAQIRTALQTTYNQLLAMGRQIIAQKLREYRPIGSITRAEWNRVRDWLTRDEVQPWRELLMVVEQMLGVPAPGAVGNLFAFLQKDSFDLELKVFRVKFPSRIGGVSVRPVGDFYLKHRPEQTSTVREFRYSLANRGLIDEQGFYRYELAGGESQLTYLPGDALWGEMKLDANAITKRVFTWSRPRTQIYQFEALRQAPYFHREDESASDGEVASTVEVQLIPEAGIPTLPELMPQVR